MSGAATRRASSDRKKFCEQCPVCAKQNVSSRLRRFQVNWDDYVTLCENEQCLYPLVMNDDAGNGRVASIDLSNKMDNCSSATRAMSNGRTLDDPAGHVGCQSSLSDASTAGAAAAAAATQVPDFLAALQNFSMDCADFDESVIGDGSSLVPRQAADSLDSGDILHRLMFFGDDAGDNDAFRSDELDSLVAMLNNVTSDQPTNNGVQRPQSVTQDNDQDFASTAPSSPTATVTDLDSRASTPDRVIQRDLCVKKPFMSDVKSIETRIQIESTSKQAVTAESPRKSIVKQSAEQQTSSVVTTKSTKTSSVQSTKRASVNSMHNLNFLNIFPSHKCSTTDKPRKRSTTCTSTVVALTTSKETINKNKLVTTWLSKSDLAAQLSKKNTFSGFQSYSSARNQNQKDDGSPSEDSGIQSPLSLRSADSDSTAIR